MLLGQTPVSHFLYMRASVSKIKKLWNAVNYKLVSLAILFYII